MWQSCVNGMTWKDMKKLKTEDSAAFQIKSADQKNKLKNSPAGDE